MLFNNEGHVASDNWYCASKKADLLSPGDMLVSWGFWCEHGDALIQRREQGIGQIGVQLTVDDPFEEVIRELDMFALIVLYFEKFTDGRHFSRAALISRRYRFSGELRAAGSIHSDQLAYLRRVGFNAFSFDVGAAANATNISTAAFSEVYQGAADGLQSVRDLRAALR